MMKREEFIGRHVKVLQSSCKNQTGLEGKVVDETKNTLVIETKNGEKTVLKKNCCFIFEGKDVVKGCEILFRPEERTKKVK